MKQNPYDPEAEALEIDEACVRMVQQHEKPAVIHKEREKYLYVVELTESEHAAISQGRDPQFSMPSRFMHDYDSICRWHEFPMK